MSTVLRYPKGYQFFDSNGKPLALANLYYYVAGTTTPQNTYADSAGAIPNTNPVVLDGSGRLQVDVYLGSAANYKEVLTAAGVTVSPWPDDNISSAAPGVVFTGDSGSGGTSGLVPAPAAGDALANKFLKADGSWAVTPGGGGSASTNLTVTETATTVSIASSNGSGATIAPATSTVAGVLDSARAAKIDGLATVATSGNYNDLSGKPALPSAGTATPAMNGTAIAGSSDNYARSDHVHPTDTGRAANIVFTGDSGSGGAFGLVPAPAPGDASAGKYLKADGSWTVPPIGGGGGSPGGSSGQLQVNNGGAFGGMAAINGDATLNTATGTITVTKTNGASFATVATSGAYADLSGKPSTMTPSAHSASHAAAGSDPLSLSASQVSGIPASLSGQNLDNVVRVGIGTTDTGNVLSVKGPTTLFANTGDCRVTMSKGAAGNTAAFNFQDNYSTRVQFGLLGNDSFTISTSADGSTFNNAIVATTGGAVAFPNTPGFSGDSGSGGSKGLVPAPAAGDAAAGKYLKADGTWTTPPGGGGGGSPGGSPGQIQYNNAGAFGGVPISYSSGGFYTFSNGTGTPATPSGGATLWASSGVLNFKDSSGNTCVLPPGGTLLSNSTSANLTAGYTTTSYGLGTVSSGIVTLSAANGNIQHVTNNGAFTLAPQPNPSTIALEIVNGASAGAITTSSYTKVVGSFGTTSGSKFQCISCVTNSSSALYITEVV